MAMQVAMLESLLKTWWFDCGIPRDVLPELLQRTMDYDYAYHAKNGHLAGFRELYVYGLELAKKWDVKFTWKHKLKAGY